MPPPVAADEAGRAFRSTTVDRAMAMSRERAPDVADLPAPPGLCAECVHRRLVASRRSTFLYCGLSEHDPRFPRYPPLPVLSCDGFQPREVPGDAGG